MKILDYNKLYKNDINFSDTIIVLRTNVISSY